MFTFIHRYLGIAISLVFMLWFASAIVIIYTGPMPFLSETVRLSHQAELNLNAIEVTPGAALNTAKRVDRNAVNPTLRMIMGRPAYQFRGVSAVTVFADDGSLLTAGNVSSASVARDFAGLERESVSRLGTIDEVDQWTISLRRQLPLEKFAIDDGLGTQLYVSPKTAQVVLATNSRTRLQAWFGAIPHWLYFLPLRKNSGLWADVVVLLSGLGTGLTVAGLILLFLLFKKRRPFKLSRAIPYKGLMRWHYILGAPFGLFVLTWVFSGMMSMEPFSWKNTRALEVDRQMFQGGEVELHRFGSLVEAQTQLALQRVNSSQLVAGSDNALSGLVLKELSFSRIMAEDFYELYYGSASSDSVSTYQQVLLAQQSLAVHAQPFDAQVLLSRLADRVSEAKVIEHMVLEEYDNYYYSRANKNRLDNPLPVLRVKLDDPAQSWFYIDLNTAQFVSGNHRLSRIERWLYHGLHSLDFSFWYNSRPWWDIGVISLLLGGLGLCGIGCYLGLKRLGRNTRNAFDEST